MNADRAQAKPSRVFRLKAPEPEPDEHDWVWN